MKILAKLLTLFIVITSCGPSASPTETDEPQSDENVTQTVDSTSVNTEVQIDATPARVWEVITSPEYKKVLGAEFDKNAFMESDYKPGSKVYFKYEPNRVVTTGTITKLTEEEYIQIDYDFSGFAYTEQISLVKHDGKTTLKIYAGPYTSDLEAQKVVWKNWLLKVKEISELDKELTQGTHAYELYYAEWDGRMPNAPCEVTIAGDKITVKQTEKTNLTGGDIIAEGTLMKHKTGVWIIGDKPEDALADEIGGCTGGPIPIDFTTRIIEWC